MPNVRNHLFPRKIAPVLCVLVGAVVLSVNGCAAPETSPQTPAETPTAPAPVEAPSQPPPETPAPLPVETPPRTPVEKPSEPPPETTPAAVTHQTLATGDVGTNEYSPDPPGKSTKLPREYPGAPPLIPHDITGLMITKDTNTCSNCHVPGISFGEGHTATKIPESHYIDIPSGIRSETIQELRYNCLSCHLPQSAEEPLVEQTEQP